MDMNIIYSHRDKLEKEARDKRRAEDRKLKEAWEKHAPRIPTLLRNFMDLQDPVQFYNPEANESEQIVDLKKTCYDVMYGDLRQKDTISALNSINDVVYNHKSDPQLDKLMWQGYQSLFGKHN